MASVAAHVACLSRSMLIVMFSCLVVILPACDRSKSGGGGGAPRIADHIVVAIEDSSQDDSAELTITALSRGFKWSLFNRSRSTKIRTLLTTGTRGTGNFASVRDEIKEAVRQYVPASSEQGPFTLSVTCLDDHGAWASSISSEDRRIWDQVLPHGGQIEQVWREARGTSTKYWFWDVGPIDGANREHPQPAVKDGP